jgi:hypothetical protein
MTRQRKPRGNWQAAIPPSKMPPASPRRGGRVADCTGLENRHPCKWIQGSNPCLSAPMLSRYRYSIAALIFNGLKERRGRHDLPHGKEAG